MDIPLYRLHNQRLSRPDLSTPQDVVHWLGAVQSQDYAGAKWAIGLRATGLTDPDLDHAFAVGSILRTHILRPTWHFVTPTDIRWMLALTAPRIRALLAYMDRQLGLDKAVLKKSHAALVKALQGGNHLTRAELGNVLEKSAIHVQGQPLGHIMMHAELDAVVCSGPRKGKQFTYALLEERVPATRHWSQDESLAELMIRYIQSHGPATLHDFCIWSGLTMRDAQHGIEMVKSQLQSETIEGKTYWHREQPAPIREKRPTAYLLPNYDEYFIGFKDRSAITNAVRQTGVKKDDPALLSNVVILNGQVVGGWQRVLKKDKVVVEASLIVPLTKGEETAVQAAANQFGTFVGLPVEFTFKEYRNEQRKTRSF